MGQQLELLEFLQLVIRFDLGERPHLYQGDLGISYGVSCGAFFYTYGVFFWKGPHFMLTIKSKLQRLL